MHNFRDIRTNIACLAVLLAALALGGCAAAVAAPIAEQVAGGVAEQSNSLFQAGKYESYQPVAWSEVTTAARKAAADLELQPVREKSHPEQIKLTYKDDRKQEIVITIVRRTAVATEIHVDVGLFGTFGMGQLTLRQILANLPEKPAVEKHLPQDKTK